MLFLHVYFVTVTKHTSQWISDLGIFKKNEKNTKASILSGLENPKIEKKSKSKKNFFPKKKKKIFLLKNHF